MWTYDSNSWVVESLLISATFLEPSFDSLFVILNASKCMETGAGLSVHAVCPMSRLPRQVLFAKALGDHLGVRPN